MVSNMCYAIATTTISLAAIYVNKYYTLHNFKVISCIKTILRIIV